MRQSFRLSSTRSSRVPAVTGNCSGTLSMVFYTITHGRWIVRGLYLSFANDRVCVGSSQRRQRRENQFAARGDDPAASYLRSVPEPPFWKKSAVARPPR